MDTFGCMKCDKTFKNKYILTRHQRMHNGTALVCDLCEKRFYLKTHLKQHRIAHTFEKPYACDVDGCKTKFTIKSSMKKHKLSVHEKVPGKYRCEQCGRSCITSDRLDIHRRTHTGERPYACTECAMKFGCRDSLRKHYRCKHTLEQQQYACAHCEKTFTDVSNRNRHQKRTHN